MDKHEGSLAAAIIWIASAVITWLFMLPSSTRLISALTHITTIV